MENKDTATKFSEQVQENIAYEYLCHLQEAKIWMESVLKETLPSVTELEENLRNGVYLARIGNVIAPEKVPLSRIYDIFQHRFRYCGLQFKHTDNINYWIKALDAVSFPKIFHPETMDIYDKKNMPKVIYCIHALSTHLFKLGKAPSIQDLYGKVEFSRDEINTVCNELKNLGAKIPSFKQINAILINESDCDQTLLQTFISNVNEAISYKSSEKLMNCLSVPGAELVHVIPENIEDYLETFKIAKEEKSSTAKNRSLRNSYEPDVYDEVLTLSEIQGYIRSTNCACFWRDIQSFIRSNNCEKLKETIPRMEMLELTDFKSVNVDTYVEVLLKLELGRLKISLKSCSPREILENIIRNGNNLCKERKKVSDLVIDVKNAVGNKSLKTLIKTLKSSSLKIASRVLDANATLYLRELESRLKLHGDLDYHDIKSSVEAANNGEFSIHSPTAEGNLPHNSSMEAISVTCTNENLGNDKTDMNTCTVNGDLEKRITLLQACIRGFLVRAEIKKRGKSFNSTHSVESKLKRKLETVSGEMSANFTDKFSLHISEIRKIQAFWRGYEVRKSLKLPALSENCPKFLLLRRMALVHQINGHDYSEHLKLQSLRSSVVETIKKNQELASKLDEIDTKIGLLVHNRMAIQNLDIVGKRWLNGVNNDFQSKGIKTFTKEAKTVLDGYRQLFYTLQTDPTYLTRLITRLPQKSTHVIESCVLSMFNYGSSSRDAYLLLRLFRSAIVEEVKCKFQRPIDAIKGNPLVLRLALGYSRQYGGYNSLRNILGCLVENVLNEKTYIDTSPVDIYRRWVNKIETETGKPFDLPSTVTREEALSYPEVSRQLKKNLKVLKMWVKTFLTRITICADKFPYALRFIAKILWKALREKFSDTSEKDITKIVGNLVFYQYINSAIVAPDTFYIISLPPGQQLKPEQRRNLASIAKILQFAASKKEFGVESQHLMCMNSFIISSHEEMNLFCTKCFTVEDLEEHFNMTKYSEAALIEKPKIYITLEEICECHKILFHERQHISSDPFDPIQEILDSLGDPPSIAALVGCSPEEAMTSRAGKTQVCLELDNKFQLPPEDPTEAEKLFIITKDLIMSRISNLKGRSLAEAVEKGQHSDIESNLMRLELLGMVKSSDDYGAIIESIMSDLTQKEHYKRSLAKEMRSLNLAKERLNEKRRYYEDQLSYYEQYLSTCLDNLTRSSNKTGRNKMQIKVRKYSASHLLEKGVLISLDGVPSSQLKNVQFEIAATELNGIYSMRGRFMGVEVEKVNLDVQDLLLHQFEGQPVMDLFGKAKINVNLLLHLLNKKFHARI